MTSPLRIAMWSGPRNVSTACMRAFDQRPDTVVCDEPLYAHYLAHTGLDHPGAEEVIAQHEADWREVVAWLTGPLPEGRTVFYQKHMAHHLLPEIERGWLSELANCFLIRDPRHMLTSLIQILPEPTLPDTGLPQQVELFEAERERTGVTPPVIDSKDLLLDPEGVLRALCTRLGIPFEHAMLTWEPGPRSTDGCWYPHWYGNALDSTGFAPYREKNAAPPPSFESLLAQCRDLYARMHEHRILPG